MWRNLGFWIPRRGFWIPDTGFQSVCNLDSGFVSGIPDSIYWIPVSVELGLWIRSWDSGFHILDSSQCGIRILESFVGFQIPYTGFQWVCNLDSGFVSGIPDSIYWIPVSVEFGFWIRSWDSGFHILDSNQCTTWIPDSFVGFRIPYTGFQTVCNLASGFLSKIPDSIYWIPVSVELAFWIR